MANVENYLLWLQFKNFDLFAFDEHFWVNRLLIKYLRRYIQKLII